MKIFFYFLVLVVLCVDGQRRSVTSEVLSDTEPRSLRRGRTRFTASTEAPADPVSRRLISRRKPEAPIETKPRRGYEVAETIDEAPIEPFRRSTKVLTETKFEAKNAPPPALFQPSSTESVEEIIKTIGEIAETTSSEALSSENDISRTPEITTPLTTKRNGGRKGSTIPTIASRRGVRTRATRKPEEVSSAAPKNGGRGSRRRVETTSTTKVPSRSRDITRARTSRRLGTKTEEVEVTTPKARRNFNRRTPPVIDEQKLEVLPLFEREPKTVRPIGKFTSRRRSFNVAEEVQTSATENDVKVVPRQSVVLETRTELSRRKFPTRKPVVKQSVISHITEVTSKRTVRKHPEVKKSSTSSEEIDDGDNYPPQFKALLKAKQHKESRPTYHPSTTAKVITSLPVTQKRRQKENENEVVKPTKRTEKVNRAPRKIASRSTTVAPSRDHRFHAKFQTDSKPIKPFSPKPPRGLYSSRNKKEPTKSTTQLPITKKLNRFSSKYRNDASTRSARTSTNAPAYLPTIPRVTQSTLVSQQDKDLGVEVISFDDPVNAIASANLVSEVAKTEKPVSIIESIINSISAISTTEPPNLTQFTTRSGDVKESAILRLTRHDKTVPTQNTVVTTEKPTTIIERIISSLSAIQADRGKQVGSDFNTISSPSTTPISRVTKSAQFGTTLSPLDVFQEISNDQTLQKRTIDKLLALLNSYTGTTQSNLVVVTPKTSTTSTEPSTQSNLVASTETTVRYTNTPTTTVAPIDSISVDTETNFIFPSTIPSLVNFEVSPNSVSVFNANDISNLITTDDLQSTTVTISGRAGQSDTETSTISSDNQITSTTTSSTMSVSNTASSSTSTENIASDNTVTPETITSDNTFATSTVSIDNATSTISSANPSTVTSVSEDNTTTPSTRSSENPSTIAPVDNIVTSSTMSSDSPPTSTTASVDNTTTASTSSSENASTTAPVDNTVTSSTSNNLSTSTATSSSTMLSDNQNATTISAVTTTEPSSTTIVLNSTSTPSTNQTQDISSNLIDTGNNSTSRSGRLLSFTQPPVQNSLDSGGSKDRDYFIFAVLNNNTVLRKRPSRFPNKQTPYLIVGVLPNNTVVRRFPNGTLVPMEPVIRVSGFDTRENPPPLPEITSNQVTPDQGRQPENKNQTVEQNVIVDAVNSTSKRAKSLSFSTSTVSSTTLPTLNEILNGKTVQAFNSIINISDLTKTEEPKTNPTVPPTTISNRILDDLTTTSTTTASTTTTTTSTTTESTTTTASTTTTKLPETTTVVPTTTSVVTTTPKATTVVPISQPATTTFRTTTFFPTFLTTLFSTLRPRKLTTEAPVTIVTPIPNKSTTSNDLVAASTTKRSVPITTTFIPTTSSTTERTVPSTTFIPTTTQGRSVRSSTLAPSTSTSATKKLKELTEQQKKDLETLAQLEMEQAAILNQLSFLRNFMTTTSTSTTTEKADLANRVVALAVEREKARKEKKLPNDDTTFDELFKQLNVENAPKKSEYGTSNDAIIASLLKEQGIGPTTPKTLLNVYTQTTKKPRPKTTTTERPGPLMQSLNWLLNALAPPTTKRPKPKPKRKPKRNDDEILTHQPTHITPVVTAAPRANLVSSMPQEDIQKLIKQLEGIQKNPSQQLDLGSIKSLQGLLNVDEVKVTSSGTTGTTNRATTTMPSATTKKNRVAKSTTAIPVSVSNNLLEEDEISTTSKPKISLPPVRLRPVPGIEESDSLVRGNLLTAAVNVTRAISSFLGTALQGAASSFQTLLASGSQTVGNLSAASRVG